MPDETRALTEAERVLRWLGRERACAGGESGASVAWSNGMQSDGWAYTNLLRLKDAGMVEVGDTPNRFRITDAGRRALARATGETR